VRVAREAVGSDGQAIPQQWLVHTTVPEVPADDRRRLDLVVYGATITKLLCPAHAIFGAAVPSECPLCRARRHAPVHRKHSVVKVLTRLTNGTAVDPPMALQSAYCFTAQFAEYALQQPFSWVNFVLDELCRAGVPHPQDSGIFSGCAAASYRPGSAWLKSLCHPELTAGLLHCSENAVLSSSMPLGSLGLVCTMSCTDPLSQRIGHDTGGWHVAAITHLLMAAQPDIVCRALHGPAVPADSVPVALTLLRMLCLSALRTISCDKEGQPAPACTISACVVLNR